MVSPLLLFEAGDHRPTQALPHQIHVREADFPQDGELVFHRVGVLAATGRARLALGAWLPGRSARIGHGSVALHEERIFRAHVVEVDETHLILVLMFASAEEADRIAREVGGPWMVEHMVPLLARDTERSVGDVIASAP